VGQVGARGPIGRTEKIAYRPVREGVWRRWTEEAGKGRESERKELGEKRGSYTSDRDTLMPRGARVPKINECYNGLVAFQNVISSCHLAYGCGHRSDLEGYGCRYRTVLDIEVTWREMAGDIELSLT
jgi:hypothetical protein